MVTCTKILPRGDTMLKFFFLEYMHLRVTLRIQYAHLACGNGGPEIMIHTLKPLPHRVSDFGVGFSVHSWFFRSEFGQW